MENRRLVLAIALVLFVWSGFNLLFNPTEKQSDEPQITNNKVEINSQHKQNNFITSEVNKLPLVDNLENERIINVSSNLFKLTFSTSGARLIDAQLLKFKEKNSPDSPVIKIVDSKNTEFGTYGIFGGEGLYLPVDSHYSFISDNNDILLSDTEKTELIFKTRTQDNLQITKIYTFYPNKYYFDINVYVNNFSDSLKKGTLNFTIVNKIDESKKSDRYNFVGPVSYDGKNLFDDKINDIKESIKLYGNEIVWTAFETKYFANIIKPFDETINNLEISSKNNSVINKIISPVITFQPNINYNFKYTGYLGPRDLELLKENGLSFDKIIDLGFFDIIAKPLKIALKFFYGFLGNYGFAIVLLTVCIKAIFWPLTQKSYSSMKDMQKLQPQMQKLRAKYGKDKTKLNQEMMALYKEKKVNPFGGCLPMLIQIPVFFALYQVLLGGIELRHAPFMLWITDLSAADTLISDALGLGFALGPLPLIMGFTMFLQQKMSPTNMDPLQAKIMLFMPVFFTFIFLSFPSGLVIYWLINNVLTIAQQYLINRKPV